MSSAAWIQAGVDGAKERIAIRISITCGRVSWGVGACHYWPIQTPGTPKLYGAYGVY
jgi:hypothetical protein